MDLQQLLNTPQRPRLPFEIPETPLPLSQLSTQSWDSQNRPRHSSYELIIPSQSDLNTPSRRRQPSEIPLSQQSTQSWDSQNGPRPSSESSLALKSSQSNLPQTPQKQYPPATTRSDRIRIKTALDFNIPHDEIRKKYGFTEKQIQLAKQKLTPQKKGKCGRKPKITTPTRHRLEQWLLESDSHRHVAFRHILELAPPELCVQDCGEQAMRTAFKLVGYGRRVVKKNGFSDDPEVMAERVAFAQEGLIWTPERLFLQIFSDEVWVMGGAHT
jgi:hypothetical protein